MTNNNVLQGIQCPECKSYGPFNIHGEALFLDVDDYGVSEFENFEWSDESSFYCVMCKHHGQAKEFKTK